MVGVFDEGWINLVGVDLFNNSEWISEVLDASNTGLWIIKIDSVGKKEKMYGNSTMLRLLGLTEQPDPEACYRHWYSRIDKNHIYRVTSAVRRMIESGQQYEVQYPWLHPQKGQLFVRCGGKVRSMEGQQLCLSGYHQDVTEMENVKKELKDSLQLLSKTRHKTGEIERLKEHYQHLAYIDMLTALPNRRAFYEMGESFLANLDGDSGNYWVALVDIDHFKNINDTYGHAAGDLVLHELARRFKENLRENSEFIGRIGGEEFAIFLLDSDQKSAYGLAEKLRKICANAPYEIENAMNVFLTCSFGIAKVGVAEGKSAGELLAEAMRHADTAMYKAKNGGRNQTAVFVDEKE